LELLTPSVKVKILLMCEMEKTNIATGKTILLTTVFSSCVLASLFAAKNNAETISHYKEHVYKVSREGVKVPAKKNLSKLLKKLILISSLTYIRGTI